MKYLENTNKKGGAFSSIEEAQSAARGVAVYWIFDSDAPRKNSRIDSVWKSGILECIEICFCAGRRSGEWEDVIDRRLEIENRLNISTISVEEVDEALNMIRAAHGPNATILLY